MTRCSVQLSTHICSGNPWCFASFKELYPVHGFWLGWMCQESLWLTGGTESAFVLWFPWYFYSENFIHIKLNQTKLNKEPDHNYPVFFLCNKLQRNSSVGSLYPHGELCNSKTPAAKLILFMWKCRLFMTMYLLYCATIIFSLWTAKLLYYKLSFVYFCLYLTIAHKKSWNEKKLKIKEEGFITGWLYSSDTTKFLLSFSRKLRISTFLHCKVSMKNAILI